MFKNEEGFSLLELVVAVGVAGIIAAVALPTFAGLQSHAQTASVTYAASASAAEALANSTIGNTGSTSSNGGSTSSNSSYTGGSSSSSSVSIMPVSGPNEVTYSIDTDPLALTNGGAGFYVNADYYGRYYLRLNNISNAKVASLASTYTHVIINGTGYSLLNFYTFAGSYSSSTNIVAEINYYPGLNAGETSWVALGSLDGTVTFQTNK